MQINNNIQLNAKKVNFKGMQKSKDEQGYQSFEFFLPYDENKYHASIQLVALKKNEEDEFVPDTNIKIKEFPLKGQNFTLDPSEISLNNQVLGYRFKLQEKGTNNAVYHTDTGVRTALVDSNDPQYVVLHRNRAPLSHNGTMMHIFVDNFNPGYKMSADGKPEAIKGAREKMLDISKNHFNEYGANIAGIVEKLPYLQEFGVNKLLISPLTDGNGIGNGYLTRNAFQIKPSLGNIDDYRELIVGAAKKDMAIVMDGAFVNQGLDGVHFKHLLKYPEKTPFKNMFKTSSYKTMPMIPNLDMNNPKSKELLKHFKFRIVNGNHKYSFNKDSIEIEPNKRNTTLPTYVQLYDDRLVTKEQLKQNEHKVITRPENLEASNHYEITSSNDSVDMTPFEVPEDEIKSLEKRIDQNKGKYSEGKYLDFLESALVLENFKIGLKGPGGVSTWEGSVDTPQLNYTYTKKDERDLTMEGLSKAEKQEALQSIYMVRDSAKQAISYWVQTSKNMQIEDFLKEFKKVPTPSVSSYSAALTKNFPPRAKEVMTPGIINNVITNDYNIRELDKKSDNVLLESMMNYPLEAIEVAPELTAVFATPYFSKKAFSEEDIPKTRYQYYQETHKNWVDRKIPDEYNELYSDMDNLYAGKMMELADNALKTADKKGKLGFYDEKGNLNEKGKLAVPLVAPDIVKYMVIRALSLKAFGPTSDAKMSIPNKNGKFIYDYDKTRSINLKNITGIYGSGIQAKTPQEEAKRVFGVLKDGLSIDFDEKDKEDLANHIKDRFEGVKTEDLKMAYVLYDKAELGTGLRADAGKDLGKMANCQEGLDNFGDEYDSAISIWKDISDAVSAVDPNVYKVIEMTDLDKAHTAQNGAGRFKDDIDAGKKFGSETNMILSNYNYLYDSLTGLVGPKADSGYDSDTSVIGQIKNIFIGTKAGWEKNVGFLYASSPEGIKHSHNFISNHDKPRILHTLALDMRLFHGNKDQSVLDSAAMDFTPDLFAKNIKPSYAAIAMAQAIDTHIGPVMDDMNLVPATKGQIRGALQNLAQGTFKNTKFDAEKFGTMPINLAINDTIAQAKEKHGLVLSESQTKTLANKTFQSIMIPALKKKELVDKFSVLMPGDTTFYAGDELGETGYETPFKNRTLKDRNILKYEWLADPDKQFLLDHFKENQKISLMKQKMSALGNGETSMLKTPDSSILSMFRYDKTSELICLAHSQNIDRNEYKIMDIPHPTVEKIELEPEHKSGTKTLIAGLAGGLALGTIFKDALKPSDSVYGVCKEGQDYNIRHFENEKEYGTYVHNVEKNIEHVFSDKNKIKMNDNIMVLKKVGKLAFHGNKNQNHIKIQAYLNSKSYLNAKQKNAI